MSAKLIYDGECPFCSRYVNMLRLREALSDFQLLDARGGGELVKSVSDRGYDLNDGMVLILDDEIHHGADCIHRLSLLTSGSSIFNRMNAAVFQSKKLSFLLYPTLRFGRNTTLKALGRKPL